MSESWRWDNVYVWVAIKIPHLLSVCLSPFPYHHNNNYPTTNSNYERRTSSCVNVLQREKYNNGRWNAEYEEHVFEDIWNLNILVQVSSCFHWLVSPVLLWNWMPFFVIMCVLLVIRHKQMSQRWVALWNKLPTYWKSERNEKALTWAFNSNFEPAIPSPLCWLGENSPENLFSLHSSGMETIPWRNRIPYHPICRGKIVSL